jgi:hypothetical protein
LSQIIHPPNLRGVVSNQPGEGVDLLGDRCSRIVVVRDILAIAGEEISAFGGLRSNQVFLYS